MKVIKWPGHLINEPGVYSEVPIRTYHGPLVPANRRSASRSGLWKQFNKSAAHAWEESPYNPEGEPSEDTDAMLLGRAAHHLLLGEADFQKHFIIRPDEYTSWSTKDSKKWRVARWEEDFDVLIPSQIDAIRGMARGLYANPMVRAGILNGLIEHTMIAQDPETGIFIKIRPDAIPTDSGDYSDLKTCVDITDAGLEKAIGRDGLFMQGAMVRYVCRLLGLPFNSFTLVFVEKTAPYCVQVRTLIDSDLDLGQDAMRICLDLYAQHTAQSFWPGPGGDGSDAQYIQMLPWDRKRFEDRIVKLQQELKS